MTNSEKNKILIVSEEAAMRDSLGLILLDYYDTIKTNDGNQALEILKHNSMISQVFLDIKVPQMHTVEIFSLIKEKYPNLKIVIIANDKSPQTLSKVKELGANGFLNKPFIPEEVLEMVNA